MRQELCDAGIPGERAGWITCAGMYYVLGHTIEEQALHQLRARADDWSTPEAGVDAEDPMFSKTLDSVTPAERAYGLGLLIDGVQRRFPDVDARPSSTSHPRPGQTQ
jgi:hypothetical protein